MKRHRNKNTSHKKARELVVMRRSRALWAVARIVHVLGFRSLGIWIGTRATKADVYVGSPDQLKKWLSGSKSTVRKVEVAR